MFYSCLFRLSILCGVFVVYAIAQYPVGPNGFDEAMYENATKCDHLWRDDGHLVGRCFGLEPHEKYDQLKSIKRVDNARQCRAMCCNLGAACVSWQYQSHSKVCKLGKPVRLGEEHADTGFWCDPNPPVVWNGRKLKDRANIGGAEFHNQCTWGDELPGQCFGLGNEKKMKVEDKKSGTITTRSMTKEECQQDCCNSPTCAMWQQYPGRGCYHSGASDIWCEKGQPKSYRWRGTTELASPGKKKNAFCFEVPAGGEGVYCDSNPNNHKEAKPPVGADLAPLFKISSHWSVDGEVFCFEAKRPGVWCDDGVQPRSIYQGGRKCVKGFCGGKEDTFLSADAIDIRMGKKLQKKSQGI